MDSNKTVVVNVNFYALACKRKNRRVEVVITNIILTKESTFCKKECVVEVCFQKELSD